jgi:membrane associated rhomboid family serine protease
MLIPYSTDAPLYYYPISTVSLIVLNIACFFAFCSGVEPDPTLEVETLFERLSLQFGHGFLPWQWVTSMFMHMDIMHLIGNMIFLWSFGLVLEGKMGHFLFAGLYLAMGIVQAILVQALMLFFEGSALGASGAIFSLLAIVVIFAPVNSFEVILLFGRVIAFEMPILMFGFVYFAMNITFFFIGGAGMSSEALHLIGAMVGIPVGFILLLRGYVDCEGYDIISYFQGEQGRNSKLVKAAKKREKLRAKEEEQKTAPSREQRMNLIQTQIDQAIQEGKFDAAVALQKKLATLQPEAGWQRQQLVAIIRGYLTAEDYAKAELYMTEYISVFEEQRFAMQLKLLKLWLHQQRPRRVLRFVQGLNISFMTKQEQLQLQQLAQHASKMIKAGVLEVE